MVLPEILIYILSNYNIWCITCVGETEKLNASFSLGQGILFDRLLPSEPGENRGERLGEFESRSVKTRDAVEGFHLLEIIHRSPFSNFICYTYSV